MQTEYDIERALKRIENELQESMIRNLKRHRAQEIAEGFEWEQWQAVQLRELERYKAENLKKYAPAFREINETTQALFRDSADKGKADSDKHFESVGVTPLADTSFARINDQRLNSLLVATQADFTRAEYAVLRRANDQYRQIIFDAQVYAQTGGTYEQAVDMATKDFLRAGINAIQYKNGSRHTISDYATMAIRTGNKRAYLMGEGNSRDEHGIHTVRVNSRTQACPLCARWLNRILVDDVYSGGTAKEARENNCPTLSYAISQGFLHPNCKDIYSTYIPGISKAAKPWTKEELTEITNDYNAEQEQKHAQDMYDSYKRMSELSLDPANQAMYQARADRWKLRVEELGTIVKTLPTTAKVTANKGIRITAMPPQQASLQAMTEHLDREKVARRTVTPLEKPLTEPEIIKKIAGGDKTEGSCASVAFAYAGNKCGLDVLDFRGGKSRKYFAGRDVKIKMLTRWEGVRGFIEEGGNDFTTVKKLLKQASPDTEYILGTGGHAAVVKSDTRGNWQYLELQSQHDNLNRWYTLSEEELKYRFGCQKSRTRRGHKIISKNYLIEIDSLKDNEAFKELLEYLNTAPGRQRKGVYGGIK